MVDDYRRAHQGVPQRNIDNDDNLAASSSSSSSSSSSMSHSQEVAFANDEDAISESADGDQANSSDRSEDYEDIVDEHDPEDYYDDNESEDSSGYQDHHGDLDEQHDYDVEDDSLGSEVEDDINQYSPEEYLKHDPTPDTPYPKPDWFTFKELRNRVYGFSSTRQRIRRPSMYWFERYASNSLWLIQRLRLEKNLLGHSGCVGSLDFNTNGDLICSGSDDLSVCIWKWQSNSRDFQKKIVTDHTSNVFQSLFCQSDRSIVTSGRDGTVRITDIETSFSELLHSDTGEIGKLDFSSPHILLTCGTNAAVNLIDLRTKEANKLLVVRDPKNNRTFQLHSINVHPMDKHKIAVAGSLQHVLLYDLRRMTRETNDIDPKPTHCLGISDSIHIVTSTAFNSTGDKLLISYNDDDLYVCRTDTCQVVHSYKGHRNKKTIKGCAWFGDNYVLSGSDDGHIYGWDLESEHIVCFLKADNEVVNCLCVHPNLPVLASAGFDNDVKIWEPVSSTWPQTLKGIKPQICRNAMRRKRCRSEHARYSARVPYDQNSNDMSR